MGKSDKKNKSDRINPLRKKYDAFLEEDKKRKERNEYILEKLDKMRYNNAVVPVRQTTTVFLEPRAATIHNVPKQAVESPISLPYNVQRLLHLKTPRKHVDEIVLQEISKKYILIPKLRPTLDDFTDIKPNLDDNTDWKSKYQILEQLKRDEKEPDSPTREEIFQAVPKSGEANINYKETTTKEDIQPPLEYINETPDHILSKNQLSYNLQSNPNDTQEVEQRYNDNNVNKTEPANDGLDKYKNNVGNIELRDTLTDNDIDGKFDNFASNIENNDYDHIKSNENNENMEKNIDNYGYVGNEESTAKTELDTTIKKDLAKVNLKADASQNNTENEYIPVESSSIKQPYNDSNQQFNTNQEIYLDREEVTLAQNVNASDLTLTQLNVINNDIAPDSDSNEIANTDYPIETINVKDFTPHDDVQLVDGVNINPAPQVLVGPDNLNHHYDPIVETETKTIDGEQSQEFYNEQVDQNYDYTEEGVADNYNTEYTAPNENYEQNVYAYYDGAQTEEVYPEANDNEETSQRYDQNYEQQYVATYDQEAYPQQDYEQPEYLEQIQHYEDQDQTQQDLGTVQYQDNLTPQNLEQQLDNEQGYAEKQDENIEITNVENQQNIKVGDQ